MKYFALIGLLIALAILGLGWHMASEAPQPVTQARTTDNPKRVGDPVAIGRDILKVRQLNAQLASIEAHAFEPRSDGALIAFSRVSAADLARLANAGSGDDKPKHRKSRVSLLYSGQDFNRAVIDGKYVRRGDRLPNGARVLKISENSVLIRSGRRRHVLQVPNARRIAKSSN